MKAEENKKKIESLTPDQEASMDAIADAAIKNAIGGDCSYDEPGIREFFNFIYELADLKKPERVIICKSPTEALGLCSDDVKEIDRFGIGYDSGWTSFYKFMESIGVDFSDIPEWAKWKKVLDIGLFGSILFDDTAIAIIRPKEVHTRGDGSLHNEKGPAVLWSDGTCAYFLNGVSVPRWLVDTDSGRIDPKLALTEKNVDVQREIIRKVGAERMLKAADAKTLDVFVDSHTGCGNEYKLMEMVVGSIRRKYLFFEHASIPNTHFAQPVHPSLKSALRARAWMLNLEIEEMKNMTDDEVRAYLPVNVS